MQPKSLSSFLFALICLVIVSACKHQGNYDIYHHELRIMDSVRIANKLSPTDSTISDFFIKEVRYKNFSVSLYRFEDAGYRNYDYALLKTGPDLRVFPLTDPRLLEDNKLQFCDANQLDIFLKEIIKANGDKPYEWYDRYEFISRKILLPILDLHIIEGHDAEQVLVNIKSKKYPAGQEDCQQKHIRTYEYIIEQQKQNAPKYFFKHPLDDEGLVYELDFAKPNGSFKVCYLSEDCFINTK